MWKLFHPPTETKDSQAGGSGAAAPHRLLMRGSSFYLPSAYHSVVGLNHLGNIQIVIISTNIAIAI